MINNFRLKNVSDIFSISMYTSASKNFKYRLHNAFNFYKNK